jgi:pimeloyl-ACP methyl ester carboxylesterase
MAPVPRERRVANGDVTLRVEVSGDGPPILCIHGWPELPRSWRHQVEHFTRRGFTVAALEVRGYGESSSPPQVERYTLTELAGDVAAVARALGDDPVILFGHDWGAPIAWHAAIRYPDLVRGVAGLSVPFTPPGPFSLLDLFDQVYADRFFYMLSFQAPGVVEAEFEADVRTALRRVYYAGSASATVSLLPEGPRDATLLSLLPDPPAGPLPFMTDDDFDVYVRTFERSGFRGAFNRYRAVALDPAATADIAGATVDRPACFIGGEHDLVRSMVPGADLFANTGAGCTDFRGSTIVAGAGHWVQQEAPAEVNAALDAFVDGL